MYRQQIIPKVEKRLATWLEIQERNRRLVKPGIEPISITISREFGCQGYPLATALQEELERATDFNWTIFDKRLIEMISRDHQISKRLLENLGERSKYLDYVIATLMPGWKSEEEAYRLIARTIFSLARQGNAIFIGRGAYAVTQQLKNCFHYRLIAPMAFRVKTYAALMEIDEQESDAIVQDKSSRRNHFMQDFYNSLYDGNEFHIIFNNSRMSIKTIAETIRCSLSEVLKVNRQ